MHVPDQLERDLAELAQICGSGSPDVLGQLVRWDGRPEVVAMVLGSARKRPPTISAFGWLRQAWKTASADIDRMGDVRQAAARTPKEWAEFPEWGR